MTVYDATANEQMGMRSVSARASKDSLLGPADSLVARSVRYMETLDHTPRRGATDPVDHAFELRAASMGPPRRVIVWDHPPDRQPGVQEAGSAVMDVLRRVLGSSRRFVPVNHDSTLAILATTRSRDAVMAALHTDLMVSIRGNASRTDSVSWVITVWDAGAPAAYNQRVVPGPRVPLAAPLTRVDTLVAQTVEALAELDRAPRRSSDVPGMPPTPVKVP